MRMSHLRKTRTVGGWSNFWSKQYRYQFEWRTAGLEEIRQEQGNSRVLIIIDQELFSVLEILVREETLIDWTWCWASDWRCMRTDWWRWID